MSCRPDMLMKKYKAEIRNCNEMTDPVVLLIHPVLLCCSSLTYQRDCASRLANRATHQPFVCQLFHVFKWYSV